MSDDDEKPAIDCSTLGVIPDTIEPFDGVVIPGDPSQPLPPLGKATFAVFVPDAVRSLMVSRGVRVKMVADGKPVESIEDAPEHARPMLQKLADMTAAFKKTARPAPNRRERRAAESNKRRTNPRGASKGRR